MNYKIQLISLIFSFFNYKMIKNTNVFLKYLISLFYVFDMALLYILLMYKINYGVIHIYFIGILLIGYILGFVYVKKLQKYCKIIKLKLKK